MLEDFPDDGMKTDPSDLEGMVCPISFNRGTADETLAGQVRQEVRELVAWYDLAKERRGRSTFGAANLDIEGVVMLLAQWADGQPPSAETATLKLAVEDLKVFYLEAAGAQPSRMSSTDMANWFWHETAGGRLLLAVHKACVGSDNEAWRLVGANYIVPRAQWERLGIDASSWKPERR